MRRLVALVGLFILVGGLLASCGPKDDAGAGGGTPEPKSDPAEGALDE
ncbi:MAG: hypothetical protein GEEBNDBF_01265 [bacterium]|nr:hypothetical protein [bacterium]